MSDKASADEDYFGNDNDSPVNRAARDDDDEGDPELAMRNEDENDVNGDEAQEPEDGEDKDDAGYGGDETYGGEAGENHDEIADQEEDGIDEIQYTKDEEDVYDEYVDDEDDTGRRGGKDKKKKDKRDTSRRKKKLKKNDGQEEAEEDPYAEEEEEKKKKPKKDKKKADVVDPADVQNLIDEMLEAYDDDIIAFKNKDPAMAKLRLLPRVDASLKRETFQRAFLDSDHGLDALSKWLQKLPNGALPSLQIRKKLLDIIFQLPVQEDHLRESEIGKIVYGMRNNATEDPELKKTIKDIIDKWTRIITGANDYDTTVEDIRGERKKIDVSLDEYRQRSMSSLRRSIPKLTMKKSGYDFVRKPEAGGTSSRSQRSQTTEGQCDKIIKDMKRKIKKDLR